MESIQKDLLSLEEWGTSYFRESFLKKEVKKPIIHYGKHHLQIARRLDGSTYAIDLSEACRMLFIGATRSGKTFFLRSIADRLALIKKDIMFLSDVKNEFWSSRKPVQEKFAGGLLEGEKPQAMKVATLRPTFFKQISRRLPEKNFWYSVSVQDMTRGDFFTLMNVKSMTQNQQIAMDLLWELMAKEFKKGRKFSLELIEELIETMDELSSSQKQLMIWKFRPLKNSNFYEEKWERSLVSLFAKNIQIAIDMENFDSFGKDGNLQLPEVTMNIALREVILARRSGRINPLWVFLDEASRFISIDKTNSLKTQIMESIDLDSRYNINYAFATQVIEDMPTKLIKQCKYIFVPSTADTNTIKSALLSTGLARNQQYALNQSIYLKKRMAKVKYSWIVLNRMEGSIEHIVPLPPLSFHLETSD